MFWRRDTTPAIHTLPYVQLAAGLSRAWLSVCGDIQQHNDKHSSTGSRGREEGGEGPRHGRGGHVFLMTYSAVGNACSRSSLKHIASAVPAACPLCAARDTTLPSHLPAMAMLPLPLYSSLHLFWLEHPLLCNLSLNGFS